jgi:hypothetical protein
MVVLCRNYSSLLGRVEMYYRGDARVLQRCHRGITGPLQGLYTEVLQGVTAMLQGHLCDDSRHHEGTLLVEETVANGHVVRHLHRAHLNCCYTVIALLLHCCYTTQITRVKDFGGRAQRFDRQLRKNCESGYYTEEGAGHAARDDQLIHLSRNRDITLLSHCCYTISTLLFHCRSLLLH